MNATVLVIGGGGREHAIVDALHRSPSVGRILCAPGNAGIAAIAECFPIADTDVQALLQLAEQQQVDLTVVGPEAALAAGVVDTFRQHGLNIFGHTMAATRIESSKLWAKQLMQRHQIPTAPYRAFYDYEQALAYVREQPLPIVVKYDGLAAGKGVTVAHTLDEAQTALAKYLLPSADVPVLVETYMSGREFSLMAFIWGEQVSFMPVACDYKRAFDHDLGPNTGSMGAYAPVTFLSEDERHQAEQIVRRVASLMVAEGCPLTGVLYAGLMQTDHGICVVEFNARFGDPEAEVVLPLLASDIYPLLNGSQSVSWRSASVVGVVLASRGYPGSYQTGYPIYGLEAFSGRLYHMGTKYYAQSTSPSGVHSSLYTSSGRVLIGVMEASSLSEARSRLYAALPVIQCENLYYRHDIAL